MSIVDSLPSRPLTPAEVDTLDSHPRLTWAIPAGGSISLEGERVFELAILFTDDRGVALQYSTSESAWRVVGRTSSDDTTPIDTLWDALDAAPYVDEHGRPSDTEREDP